MGKKEDYFLKKQQKEQERISRRRQKKLKKALWIIMGILIIGGGVSGLGWFLATRPAIPETAVVSKQGIHWHADLNIKILGQYQIIPADIGIGITHSPIHTHEQDGVIHMEFSGLVKEDDIRLGRFFGVWGKQFNGDCIFGKCNGSEGQLKMIVNGRSNLEFDNYIMQNSDKIEILFE